MAFSTTRRCAFVWGLRSHLLRRRSFLYGFDRNGERVPQVGLGITIDGHSEGCRPPPKLGADNAVIFRDWLGLSDGELSELANAGVM